MRSSLLFSKNIMSIIVPKLLWLGKMENTHMCKTSTHARTHTHTRGKERGEKRKGNEINGNWRERRPSKET